MADITAPAAEIRQAVALIRSRIRSGLVPPDDTGWMHELAVWLDSWDVPAADEHHSYPDDWRQALTIARTYLAAHDA